MKTDKALISALKHKIDELPYGFDDRVMQHIMLEAERQGRMSYYRSLGLVSFVSLALIAGVLYVLNAYFGFNFLDLFARIELPSLESASIMTDQTRPILAFSIYIAILMLFLLGMDQLFRRRIGKSKK